jgi:hypothetical protein
MGSALNNTARQVGAALGVALVSSILMSALSRNDYVHGFNHAWRLTSFVIFLSGAAMHALFRPPTTEDLEKSS